MYEVKGTEWGRWAADCCMLGEESQNNLVVTVDKLHDCFRLILGVRQMLSHWDPVNLSFHLIFLNLFLPNSFWKHLNTTNRWPDVIFGLERRNRGLERLLTELLSDARTGGNWFTLTEGLQNKAEPVISKAAKLAINQIKMWAVMVQSHWSSVYMIRYMFNT